MEQMNSTYRHAVGADAYIGSNPDADIGSIFVFRRFPNA